MFDNISPLNDIYCRLRADDVSIVYGVLWGDTGIFTSIVQWDEEIGHMPVRSEAFRWKPVDSNSKPV